MVVVVRSLQPEAFGLPVAAHLRPQVTEHPVQTALLDLVSGLADADGEFGFEPCPFLLERLPPVALQHAQEPFEQRAGVVEEHRGHRFVAFPCEALPRQAAYCEVAQLLR